MKKPFLLLLCPLSLFLSASCTAQDLKIISATSAWDCGGKPAASCIINYTIHLSPYNKDIVFNYFYLSGLRQQPRGHVWADTVNNSYVIRLSKSSGLIGPPQNYPGEALISYTCKGKTNTLIINSFGRAKPGNDSSRFDTTNEFPIDDCEPPDLNKLFTIVPHMPKFPGNIDTWLSQNIVYPEDAKKNNIQGIVYIGFIIEKNGAVTSIRVLRGIDGGRSLENEAIRVVSAMPAWSPGTTEGKRVRVAYTLPIHFRLNDNKVPAQN